MSHASGKVEVLGVGGERIFLRYHRARDPRDESRVFAARRDEDAGWLDELELLD